jgi:predicted AlkP superfamily pyrophosphatase or phosphodiesterase
MTNNKFRSLAVFTLSLCLFFTALPLTGQPQRQPAQGRAASARAQAHPRLVVVIVVDQFRYDFLERFGDLFTPGGFRRLMSRGALFTNANFDYTPTYTGPGHAAVFTGSVPAQNGIVGNSWFDREAGRERAMVSDSASRVVTNTGLSTRTSAPSPRILIGATIGDQLRLANNFASKVIAMSYKDRSAVLPGGRRPNGAFWFDTSTGTFISSDYYFKELPDWVKRFNTTVRPDKFFGATWDRVLPASTYRRSQTEYLPVQRSPLGQKFPYVVNGGQEQPGPRFYNAFEYTPFACEYLADFAKAAIESESLGSDEFPDLLSISFSAPDLIGHSYGPDSQEVEDTFIRLDRVIAGLLDAIDRRVGLANTIIAVTGDHGVSPVPEYLQSLGFEAGRIADGDVINAANQALTARFGDGKWVLALVNDQLHLDHKLMAERQADAAEAERIAGQAALERVPGIADFFTRTQIIEGRMPNGPIARRVMNGFHRARSGDVWLITKPFTFFAEGPIATTHGSPYNYDTHVPVIIFGAGVHAGRYDVECSPSDIAPTLAALLGIEPPPNRTGRVLVEAIATQGAR